MKPGIPVGPCVCKSCTTLSHHHGCLFIVIQIEVPTSVNLLSSYSIFLMHILIWRMCMAVSLSSCLTLSSCLSPQYINESWLRTEFWDCESFLYMFCLLIFKTASENPSFSHSAGKLQEGREYGDFFKELQGEADIQPVAQRLMDHHSWLPISSTTISSSNVLARITTFPWCPDRLKEIVRPTI